MATPDSPRKRLQEEVTCSICLDFYTNPVILDCGHNFCQKCIVQHWQEAGKSCACPLCKKRRSHKKLNSNWQMVNFVEIAKQLRDLGEEELAGGAGVCERHRETMKLFCKDDRAAICVVCDRSREHRDHHVVPVEEAVQDVKGQICSCLENLKKERDELLVYQLNTEKESQDLLNETEAKRQKIETMMKEIRQYLEKQETSMLDQIAEVTKDVVTKRDIHLAKLSEDLSSLDDTIQKLEEKSQQAASELLKDVDDPLERNEKKIQDLVVFPPRLKWEIWECCNFIPVLENARKQYEGTWSHGYPLQKVNVTLDVKTAHPKLLVSEDKKYLTLSDKKQNLPVTYRRYGYWCCVQGKEILKSKRCYWEVEVGKKNGWAVGIGVAYLLFDKCMVIGPEVGVWAIGKWRGQYCAFLPPHNPPLPLNGEIKRIRVCLNWFGPWVKFFDVETAALLYTFEISNFKFLGLQPFFGLCEKSHLQLCP